MLVELSEPDIKNIQMALLLTAKSASLNADAMQALLSLHSRVAIKAEVDSPVKTETKVK
jgi:hypothetical protein